MSFKKIKVIQAETVRTPEKDYIYLGYGYSSTYGTTAPWIKKDDGSIILISSGGTGGGTGSTTLYWQKDGNYLKPTSTSYKVSIGSTSATQFLNIDGAINIGTTTTHTAGSIRWTGTNFEGNTGGTSADWVSLTEPEGSSSGSSYWSPIGGGSGIGYLGGIVYIGGSFTSSEWDGGGYLNVQGETKVDSNILIGAKIDDSSYSTTTYKAHISGGTVAEGYLSKYDETNSRQFVTNGGFGGYSGGTAMWGLTGSFSFQASTDSSYNTVNVDVVNGLIVNLSQSDPK